MAAMVVLRHSRVSALDEIVMGDSSSFWISAHVWSPPKNARGSLLEMSANEMRANLTAVSGMASGH